MKIDLKQKRKNFTIISNAIAKDINISLKAKGMSLIIAHFPSDWVFYEDKLQDYTKDGRMAISNAIKELEIHGYLFRKQMRRDGRFDKKIWIFSDEGLTNNDIEDALTECRKSDIGKNDNEKSGTTNTHSIKTNEQNKKNSQKKERKKKFYDFVNVLKANAMEYPNLEIVFEAHLYSFANINGQLFLKDKASGIVLSKVHASKLYQKMANSTKIQIIRGEK
ncbi:MAG: hypothetical protein KA253_04020 [Campylobacteraceae bacterium]|nr:hypothetical protein [Campylobacteraceae bacterium]